MVALDRFSSLKAVTNALPNPQHYLAYVLLLCKIFAQQSLPLKVD